MLPESQMDRFIVRLTMGYPNIASEVEMLKTKQNYVSVDSVQPVVTAAELIKAKEVVDQVYINDAVLEYIVRLADATRNDQYLKLGLSPRGTIALLKMTKATALLKGRDYVIPDDIHYSFIDVVLHRIILGSKSKINGLTGEQVLKDILQTVPVPKVQ